ncbi:tripartite tricarboxylate transporter TctB family protein [Alkalihalobacillus sp. BA299]|uniref:tripartite tricarboxylate transporter TctB family protein n=1 Tax=Alkalihalobacillus sp. BA299 TaxID=2815938 RepID=UPI001ADCA602|nr:tripartite tricarboxylate transporter TctB family protein [Alkalihalobacillus sp. BA299]
MSYKIASYVSFLFFGIIGVWFYTSSLALPTVTRGMGPGYFPKAISILIIITCIVGIFTTFRKTDERVELPNIKYMVSMTVLTILFVFIWAKTGIFYLSSFILVFILLYMFNQTKHSMKKVLNSLTISIIIILSIYVIFDYLLNVRF